MQKCEVFLSAQCKVINDFSCHPRGDNRNKDVCIEGGTTLSSFSASCRINLCDALALSNISGSKRKIFGSIQFKDSLLIPKGAWDNSWILMFFFLLK